MVHLVLQQLSFGKRGGIDEMEALADRAHGIIRTLIPTSTPSQPDVMQKLEDLAARYVNGISALCVKTWSKSAEERGTTRWALSKVFLRQLKPDRICALMKGVRALAALQAKETKHVYYNETETCWRLTEKYADVALNPQSYKNSGDLELKRIATTILLPCRIKPSDSNAKEHMLSESKADIFFRLAETLNLMSSDHFNQGHAFFHADPAHVAGPASKLDPSKNLGSVVIKNSCMDVDIEMCKEYVESGGEANETSRFLDVAKAFQAITLPPESFTNQYRMYAGQDFEADDGSAKFRTVPLHDPTGYKVTIPDLMYRKSSSESDDVLGPALQHAASGVMTGQSPMITYKFGDALYEKVLRSRAAQLKFPEALITRWHVPGWVPAHSGAATSNG